VIEPGELGPETIVTPGCAPDGLHLIDVVPGLALGELQRLVRLPIRDQAMTKSNPSRRTFLLHSIAGAAALGSPLGAFAQTGFPVRPIRIVVPYAAGGGTDVVGRPLAQAMSTELGQAIIIDNKPGAGTVIGSDAVAKAAPDGYTLLMTTSAIAINASLVPKLPYDTDRDLTSVGRICQGPLSLPASPTSHGNRWLNCSRPPRRNRAN